MPLPLSRVPSLEFTKQAVSSARRAKPQREIMGEEVKVSKTLSPLPCPSPPPLPPSLSLVFMAPTLPIIPPSAAACACTVELLERLKMQEHIPQFMSAAAALFRFVNCFVVSAVFPPFSHARRCRSQKMTDGIVKQTNEEDLGRLGLSIDQAKLFMKEMQTIALPPQCMYDVASVWSRHAARYMPPMFHMALQLPMSSASFSTIPPRTAPRTGRSTRHAITKGRQLACSHRTTRSTCGDGAPHTSLLLPLLPACMR
jgi:hypothetical protein